MFKVSLNWINYIIKKNINQDLEFTEILKILNLQGFEVKKISDVVMDKIITIEVKANRPDLLSHRGVAREIISFLGFKLKEVDRNLGVLNKKNFPIDIKISENICERFTGWIVYNINNKVETPEYIKNYLNFFNINSISPVVDISNYIMLEYGQPSHVYDLDKIIDKKLIVSEANFVKNIKIIGDKFFEIQTGDIIISDNYDVACVAGIIGTERLEVSENTQNILIESAVFDKIKIRTSSKRSKISTLSSFRFERGINAHDSLIIGKIVAKKIAETCGGDLADSVFDYFPNKSKNININININQVNKLIGTDFDGEHIINLLGKYNFKCKFSENHQNISVLVPNFRLDVHEDVDIIEEITRSFGYDNIVPQMPIVRMDYSFNKILYNTDKIRDILIGLGFNEIITYSFVPDNMLKVLNISPDSRYFSNIILQNPISNMYALMRPTMVFSMLNCLAFNHSVGNRDLALFEAGRVYLNAQDHDTNYMEIDTISFIISGIRIEKGWDVAKNIKYNFYDLTNYVNILLNDFGIKFILKPVGCSFFNEKIGYEIYIRDEYAGILGEINKNMFEGIVPNVKLVKDPVYFCEIYTKKIENKQKTIEFESKFPSITRLYNLMVGKNIKSDSIIKIIKESSDLVVSCYVKDMYESREMTVNQIAILFEVLYGANECTLSNKDIKLIEDLFLKKLESNLDIHLKT
ncbi:MAG: phenylalanine--tRNA ligase subunit beta [Candidatus Improbicoccus devescovinae]|nr:MAG: phenylalanine--tRNA ligase subunit beta [Candidatus Improbicoccus devescovinae]